MPLLRRTIALTAIAGAVLAGCGSSGSGKATKATTTSGAPNAAAQTALEFAKTSAPGKACAMLTPHFRSVVTNGHPDRCASQPKQASRAPKVVSTTAVGAGREVVIEDSRTGAAVRIRLVRSGGRWLVDDQQIAK